MTDDTVNVSTFFKFLHLQCLDAVGWVSRKAPDL